MTAEAGWTGRRVRVDGWAVTRRLAVLVVGLWMEWAAATPFIPQDDAQVLERLPVAGASEQQELRRMRTGLAADPNNLEQAVRLADRYLEIGRRSAEPRYFGYAQAALEPWWRQTQPPAGVLLLRATLRQQRHDFAGALTDLDQLLQVQPGNAQAWLTRAVILQVQGDYAQALRGCLPLLRLASRLIATACLSSVGSLAGKAQKSYQVLRQTLENYPTGAVEERLWALTTLAEIAVRLGDDQAAEQHFRQALGLGVRDSYLLGAYADFLLDHDRAAEVMELLKEDTRADALLLRLALAERRLDLPSWQAHREALGERFAAVRRRGESTHLGAEARFTLYLLNDPGNALSLAQANWAVQREPQDARLVLETALAAAAPAAARPVLDWLARSGLEDVRLAALAQRIEARP